MLTSRVLEQTISKKKMYITMRHGKGMLGLYQSSRRGTIENQGFVRGIVTSPNPQCLYSEKYDPIEILL